jgi:hypothetical protein
MDRLSVPRAYALTKRLIEREALSLRQQHPELHLAECCQRVIERRPFYWRVYREAMKARCASEFQKAKRPPSRPTSVDRVWFDIERLARTLVAASSEPLTLRNAVVRLVDAQPELLARYAAAIRRKRRARTSRRSDRATRRPSGGRSRPRP